MTNIGERRFNEGLGVRYMGDAKTIRCQGNSKNQLRKLRAERNDWESPSEDFWPDAQCSMPAEPGLYVCKFHGGMSRKKEPRTVLDMVPIALRQKLEMVQDNPNYLDRSSDIYLLEARKLELLERLSDNPGQAEAWGMVGDALYNLRKGELIQAENLLDEAMQHSDAEKEIWKEITGLAGSQQVIASTQAKVMKDLKLMVTMEQVMYLISVVQRSLGEATERFIDDPRTRQAVVDYVSRRLLDASGSSPTTTVERLAVGSAQES